MNEIGFLSENGFGNAIRSQMKGDASTRSYERLFSGDRTAILMKIPQRGRELQARDGRPYKFESLHEFVPFIAIAQGLRSHGFSAPKIFGVDYKAGLLLLEDFGDVCFVQGSPSRPVEKYYEAAVDVLLELHTQALPKEVSLSSERQYTLPNYDVEAFNTESALFIDWYLPWCGSQILSDARNDFHSLWSEALESVVHADLTWVLRDYHSPNLIWLPKRKGVMRVGLLDFQDAAIGPAAYDLASLLQDARVDVPKAVESMLFEHYVGMRRSHDPLFDERKFARAYAVIAAQRATKILGVFTKLSECDGRSEYIGHIPRVREYLERSLSSHSSLSRLKEWYGSYVPDAKITRNRQFDHSKPSNR